MNWETPKKPAEFAEQSLIRSIIDNSFPVNSFLPNERELAQSLGITRPTLREALQRLARDGWVEIHQGKPTRVMDYWKEGNLNVLFSLSKIEGYLPAHFIIYLLQTRTLLSPTYTKLAIIHHREEVILLLRKSPSPSGSPEEFSNFDLELHTKLTQFSENPVFTLILNGFQDLIKKQSILYFQSGETRSHSNKFYQMLLSSAENNDPELAFQLTEEVMRASALLWQNYVEKEGDS